MSFLSGKIKIPGAGEVPKGAAVAGLAVVGYLIYRYRTKAAAAPAAAAAGTGTGQYPPDGTTGNPSDPYSTDPATGQTYGDEQGPGGASGLLTGAQQYPWDGTYSNPSDPFSMDPGTGVTYGTEGNLGGTGSLTGGGGSGGGSGVPGPPFSTNAQWAQYATDYLVNTIGLAAGTVGEDLGLYINGEKVTAGQEDVINQAITYAGSPPVTGKNGKPPGINLTGTKTGGGGGGGVVTVPNVVGQRVDAARTAMSRAGLKISVGTRKSGVAYHVTAQNPRAGVRAARNSTVHLTIKAATAIRKK